MKNRGILKAMLVLAIIITPSLGFSQKQLIKKTPIVSKIKDLQRVRNEALFGGLLVWPNGVKNGSNPNPKFGATVNSNRAFTGCAPTVGKFPPMPSLAQHKAILDNIKTQTTKKLTQEKILLRFLSYVRIESQSIDDPDPNTFPMTEGQKRIAEFIYNEIKGFGEGVDVKLSPDYYIYARVPSNMDKDVPSVLFLAHMDVTPEANGNGIKPQVHRRYKGGDIALGNGLVLSPYAPAGAHLKDCIEKTIVTSDGTTLLGADDKTGCAILVTMIEQIVKESSFKHGDVYVCLSQNEDVAKCADRMDLSYFDKMPDILVDVDGGSYGEVSVSNFTAEGRTYLFEGNLAHPSYGKEYGYADARTAMGYFLGQIPPELNPAHSEGKQGYIHCYDIQQLTNKQDVRLRFRLRYFDKKDGMRYQQILDNALSKTKQAYPEVKISMEDSSLQYENIAYSMHPKAVEVISRAAKKMKIPMRTIDLRAGTTASLMVAKGLPGGPCIYSGQNAEHSVYEWTCIEDLVEITDLCQEIVKEISKLKLN